MLPTDTQIRHAIRDLLKDRLPLATVCPSEVARALAPEDWRPLMPGIRVAALAMAREGSLEVRQGGHTLDPEEPLRGPIRLGRTPRTDSGHPVTPDGRYFVVRGRLWRMTNPNLPADVREGLVKQLMDARRALRGRHSDEARRVARQQVDDAKRALGERGPVWWTDGAPDFNRRLASNTPYGDWLAEQLKGQR